MSSKEENTEDGGGCTEIPNRDAVLLEGNGNEPLRGEHRTASAGDGLSDFISPEELMNLIGEMKALRKSMSSPFPRENMTGGDDDDEDEELEWHSPFKDSCYTLIYMCGTKTHGFWHGLFVILLQILTISLTLAYSININDPGNPLQVPPMVDTLVTIAQAIALYLAVPFQADLIESVIKLHQGFYPEVYVIRPEANFVSWLLSSLLQLTAGLLLLSTIFVLTMQSDNVVGIMLNFAALHFMAEIDDIGFSIANKGFLSTQLQKQTEEAMRFKVPQRNTSYVFRRVLYLLALVMLFTSFGILKQRQLRGDDIFIHIYVQFGDDIRPSLSYYSGIMKQSDTARKTGHRTYYDIATKSIFLGYCGSEGAWTFSGNRVDACEDFFAKSEATSTYDVTKIPDYQWLIKDEDTGRFHIFSSFAIFGQDCDRNSACNDNNGTCVDNLCQCTPDHFGLDCGYDTVCPDLEVSGFTSGFPETTPGNPVSQKYELFHDPTTGDPVRVNSMPVFYSNTTYPANFIFYGGLRWVLTNDENLVPTNLM
jgi:hypothetical protein